MTTSWCIFVKWWLKRLLCFKTETALIRLVLTKQGKYVDVSLVVCGRVIKMDSSSKRLCSSIETISEIKFLLSSEPRWGGCRGYIMYHWSTAVLKLRVPFQLARIQRTYPGRIFRCRSHRICENPIKSDAWIRSDVHYWNPMHLR